MVGKLLVDVPHRQKEYCNLSLIVLEGKGVNLMGREWLNVIKVNWNAVFQTSVKANALNNIDSTTAQNKLAVLKRRYPAVFSKELGKVNNFKAKLNIKENAVPKFRKARPIPYSLKEVVGDEIDRLEREGILSPVSYSEWASPVVIVTRPNGRICLCGDFKSTLNPVLENEEYPMPTADELFNEMQGGGGRFPR